MKKKLTGRDSWFKGYFNKIPKEMSTRELKRHYLGIIESNQVNINTKDIIMEGMLSNELEDRGYEIQEETIVKVRKA